MTKLKLSEQLKIEREKLMKYQVCKTKNITLPDTVYDNSNELYSIAHNHRTSYRGFTALEIPKVLQEVSTTYGIGINGILSKSRKGNIIQARHVIAFILYQFLPLSLYDVAKYINIRDHSTIRHAVLKIANMIKYYPDSKKDIIKILTRLEYIKDV
jgi:chromosomal replication initiation ATPase DnaA